MYTIQENRGRAVLCKLLKIKREHKDIMIKEKAGTYFVVLNAAVGLFLTKSPLSQESFGRLVNECQEFIDKTWEERDAEKED